MVRLLIQSAIIFFGTLMAAGLLALGEPASLERGVAKEVLAREAARQLLDFGRPLVNLVSSIDEGPAQLLGWHE